MTHADLLDRLLDRASSATTSDAQAVLEPLRRYDATHHGDLEKTLHVYLSLGGNASKAAESLYLHRSGLLYRLGRIERVLGIDLTNYPHRIALELALYASRQDSRLL
ncbi:MAG: hypothetical protein NVS2B16_04070 [Chloroflexota bacterium]